MFKNLTFLFVCLFFCTFSAFSQAPANDNCANAIAIGTVTNYAFTTNNATTDGPLHPNSPCSTTNALGDSCSRDIWFVFTPEFTGQVLFTLCNTVDYDSKIVVYKAGAACPLTNADLLDCNEDCSGSPLYNSEIIFSVVADQSYILRIGSYGGDLPGDGVSGSGTFSLTQYIADPEPANNNCANATLLTFAPAEILTINYTTISTTTDGPGHTDQFCFVPGEDSVYNNVWYKFNASFTGSAEWSNCSMSTVDSRVAVYEDSNCPPAATSLVGCSDDGYTAQLTKCTNYTSRSVFPVTQGKDYLISVGGFSKNDKGIGTFTLNQVANPVIPSNDPCASADSSFVMTEEQANNFDFSFQGNTAFATWEDGTKRPTCRAAGEFWDTWFAFNSSTNSTIDLRFSAEPNATFVVDIFKDCATLDSTMTNCFRTDLELDPTSIAHTFTGFPGVPTNYLMRVSSRIQSNIPGSFIFQLVGTPLDPNYIGTKTQIVEKFSFSPNPVFGVANMKFNLIQSSEANLEICDVLGAKVIQKSLGQLNAGQNTIKLPLESLNKGIYFLRLLTDNGQKTVKFVKE
jgi:Secretion system C-terminal sorting domain